MTENYFTKERLIRTWRHDPYRLKLYDTYERGEYGKHRLAYQFYCRGELIFAGDDFYCSPMHAIDSLDAVYSLLGFLSLSMGDTDDEYFEKYTERQMQWEGSKDCEALAFLVFKYEERQAQHER